MLLGGYKPGWACPKRMGLQKRIPQYEAFFILVSMYERVTLCDNKGFFSKI